MHILVCHGNNRLRRPLPYMRYDSRVKSPVTASTSSDALTAIPSSPTEACALSSFSSRMSRFSQPILHLRMLDRSTAVRIKSMSHLPTSLSGHASASHSPSVVIVAVMSLDVSLQFRVLKYPLTYLPATDQIIAPCLRCTASVTRHHRPANGHRYVFQYVFRSDLPATAR